MVGLTLAWRWRRAALRSWWSTRCRPQRTLDAEIRRPGLGPGLCLGADADGAGGVAASGSPCPADPRDPGHGWRGGRAGLAFLAAFRCRGSGRRQRWAISPRTAISAPRFMPPSRAQPNLDPDRARDRQALEVGTGGVTCTSGAMAQQIKAALAIAADGRDSRTARRTGHRRDRLVLSPDRHRRHRGA